MVRVMEKQCSGTQAFPRYPCGHSSQHLSQVLLLSKGDFTLYPLEVGAPSPDCGRVNHSVLFRLLCTSASSAVEETTAG